MASKWLKRKYTWWCPVCRQFIPKWQWQAHKAGFLHQNLLKSKQYLMEKK